MVSFWPFGRGDETSAASFEKVLSQLSTKINQATSRNEAFRQKQRRFKVIWTLYTAFAWILVALYLTLITGWSQWDAIEYTAMAGGPVLIYGVRQALSGYYGYRVANSQEHLEQLQKQREVAIQKLKAATKYDSTQQLLDKYGGAGGKKQGSPQAARKKHTEEEPHDHVNQQQGQRTGFAPPPTANIAPRPVSGIQLPPSRPTSGSFSQGRAPQPQNLEPTEEFAPNAFSASIRPPPIRQQSTQYQEGGPKWYDRVLDVMLGEDETQAKNRIALICQSCRLVNGQAPPGARTVEDIGTWRCSSCQAWNGVESEEKRVLREMSGKNLSSTSLPSPGVPPAGFGEAADRSSIMRTSDPEPEDEGEDAELLDAAPAAGTRSQSLHRRHPGLGHLGILSRRARAHSDGTHHHSLHHNRHAAADQHEPATIRVMDPVRDAAGHEVLGHGRVGVGGGGDAVAGGGEGLVDRDRDGSQLGIGHAGEVQQVQGGVDEGDVEVLRRSGQRVNLSRGGFSRQPLGRAGVDHTNAQLLRFGLGGGGGDFGGLEGEGG
nr:protein lunapark-b [Quercus suber]